MSDNQFQINKDTLDEYLKELSKAIKKTLGRNASVEITLVGGASIITNYSFRFL